MNPESRAKAGLILSMTAFGTISLFVRSIPLPSSVIALVRGAVGALFLLLFTRLRGLKIDRAAVRSCWKPLVLSGTIMSFNWITLFESYRYTTVAVATLCYYMAPVLITLAAPLLFREKLTGRSVGCVLAALLGMVFVSGVVRGGLPEAGEALGILLGLVSAVMYATVILINKKLTGVSAYDRTMLQLGTAALVMVPYVALTEDVSALHCTALGAVLLGVVAVFHTGYCYALYFGAIARLSAQTAALLSYIDPIVAVLLSALLLKEPLGWDGALGAVLILGSMLVGELLPHKAAEAAE